ncbi:protein-L-isoaspartate carboxylmethyltransferase [Herbiconiux moechotypicola]|uniref:Uncharacterized protein n=1 Tax=Herbiconiux moechotypicola TaxID=637393 RepID=A0ABN3E7L8_9MICO|nr:protein-L-isoaspartate carboxylmethyltransferase [Herbiconiux moechotypicola]MCS5730726.1 protein-L-isoaspartate carboxylmethyltransferase [Herbiconiux moechotypicola]
MPFRSKETLERWIADYAADHTDAAAFEVLRQDGSDGADTGLVVVRLEKATTEVYMQPVAPGDPHWEVVFGARADELSLDPQGVLDLAAELVATAALCTYLEGRSQQHLDAQAAAERG